MIIWVDAQLSPRVAAWINANFSVPAAALRDLGLRDAGDKEIFDAGKAADAVILTKDSDFNQSFGTARESSKSTLVDLLKYIGRCVANDSRKAFGYSHEPF